MTVSLLTIWAQLDILLALDRHEEKESLSFRDGNKSDAIGDKGLRLLVHTYRTPGHTTLSTLSHRMRTNLEIDSPSDAGLGLSVYLHH